MIVLVVFPRFHYNLFTVTVSMCALLYSLVIHVAVLFKVSMQAEHFLNFYYSRIYGEDLVPAKCI